MRVIIRLKSKKGIAAIVATVLFITIFVLLMYGMFIWTIKVNDEISKLDRERMMEKIELKSPQEFTGYTGVADVDNATTDGTVVGSFPECIMSFDDDYLKLSQGNYLWVDSWLTSGMAGEISSVTLNIRYLTHKEAKEEFPVYYSINEPSEDPYTNSTGWKELGNLTLTNEDYKVVSFTLTDVVTWDQVSNVDIYYKTDDPKYTQIDRVWLVISTVPSTGQDYVFRCTNEGGVTAHIIAVWIYNGTLHDRYSSKINTTDLYVNVPLYLAPGESEDLVILRYNETTNSYPYTGQVVVKVITARGVIDSASYNI